MEIGFAAVQDAGELLAIYSQYIETTITFECALPTEEEFAERIRNFSACYPYLVCRENGRVIGYAYAHRQAERAAYQWNAELSIYLDREARGRGVGRRLYGALMELLRLQGIRTVYALVTSPNPASEKLHNAMGFHLMGVQKSCGYKNGAWRDVSWFEKAIGTYDETPVPLRPFWEAVPREQAERILKAASVD